ncbi:hypothetical protein D9M68_627320 [compost metagenome]
MQVQGLLRLDEKRVLAELGVGVQTKEKRKAGHIAEQEQPDYFVAGDALFMLGVQSLAAHLCCIHVHVPFLLIGQVQRSSDRRSRPLWWLEASC